MEQMLDNQRERTQETGAPETRTTRSDRLAYIHPSRLAAELGQVGTTALWGDRDGGKVTQS